MDELYAPRLGTDCPAQPKSCLAATVPMAMSFLAGFCVIIASGRWFKSDPTGKPLPDPVSQPFDCTVRIDF